MLSIIAAIGKNRELGKDNKLLWHISEDLKRFKNLTKNRAVIMGRKTFESIGKLLPDRVNIIITHNFSYKIPGAIIVDSLEKAIAKAREKSEKSEIFVIGGGQIFEQAIKIANKLYLTIVDPPDGKTGFDADTFFPDYSDFKKVVFEKPSKSPTHKYTFLELER